MDNFKDLSELMILLSSCFEGYTQRVGMLVEEQDLEEFKKDKHGTVLRIMRNAFASFDKEFTEFTEQIEGAAVIELCGGVDTSGDFDKGGSDDGGDKGLH